MTEPKTYQDAIGTWDEAEAYRCDLEKYWPYGPEVMFEGCMCPLVDLRDPNSWGFARHGDTRQSLLDGIRDHIDRALYYLLVLDLRHGRGSSYNVSQMREAIRMWEFLFGHNYSMLYHRATPRRLADLSDDELRAVYLIVTEQFENLC